MRNWIKERWARFKVWVVSILIAIGLVAVPALAGDLNLSWVNSVIRSDGSVFDPATEQAEVRLYCNGDTTPTFTSTGAAEALSVIVIPGTYSCYATTFDTFGQESGPSNTTIKTVLPALPNPPVLN